MVVQTIYKLKRQLVLIPSLLRGKKKYINEAGTCNDRILSIPVGGVHSNYLSMHSFVTRD